MRSRLTAVIKISRYFLVYLLIVSIIVSTVLSPVAYAWKPKTHVYLADQVLADVLDDGKVSIYYVDYNTGAILNKVGDYAVDPVLYQALKNNPQAYRAGSFGPDAYPDILTGQQVIHVETNAQLKSNSNAWLEHLWKNAKASNNSEIMAFTAGYLTHAAGDLYGHSFINYFTGGDFTLSPTDNAIKHVVMEGYIDKRLAKITNYDVNISPNVKNFMYSTMINSTPNSYLDNTLLIGKYSNLSLGKIFSTLRASLQKDIDGYYKDKQDYDKEYDRLVTAAQNCGYFDFSCSKTVLYTRAAAVQSEKLGYMVAYGWKATYKEYWVKDIDDGLKALPTYSHELAKALFFNPKGMDKDLAKSLTENYVYEHLMSMAGYPDAVGYSLQLVDEVLSAIPIDFIKDTIKELKEDLLNYLLTKAFGITLDQIKEYVTNPETYFTSTFSVGGGHHVTLADFNHNELHIQDNGYINPAESVDYKKMPAAYNTVVMSKLLLLQKSEVNRLLKDLGDSNTITNDNVILGFIHKLDGSEQWLNDSKMLFARNCPTYTKIFMHQTGETLLQCSNTTTGVANSDCLPYNPSNLKIVNNGAIGWLLTDGASSMLLLDNEQDAKAALAMAQRYTSQCFIGRDNKRPNRKDYIIGYWSGKSGISTVIGKTDCLPYNPANLKIVNEGASGWLLTDGVSRMLILDNEQDAKAALAMAKQYTKHCFIGRDNKRPNRKDYIVEYWE